MRICDAVSGFDELLVALEHRSLSAEEGLKLLNDELGFGWESDAQVRFRLGWLENLGIVTQRSGVWELGRKGNDEEATTPPTESLFG